MPKSRKRKKPEVKHREGFVPGAHDEGPKPNPTWWAPTMVTLMLVGLAWVVITYLSKFQFPLPFLAPLAGGNGNLIFGFVLILAGFLMTLRWR
ncbi:MAG TPA: cell division protein CrgA [Actinomycetales bacterium]|nr:cell division protein CrgA [Actinomycetales bacterium]